MSVTRLPPLVVLDDASLLPPSLQRLVEVVGVGPVLALVSRYGGTGVFVPRRDNVHATHALALLLGVESFRALAELYDGSYLEVPRCLRAMIHLRNQEMRKAAADGWSQPEIARHFGLTLRQVNHILNIGDAALQTDLFS